MRSLESELGPVRFIVVWDKPDIDRRFDFEQFKELRVIDKTDLINTLSHQFSVHLTQLQEHAEGYKPLHKILLAIYCRRALDIDYCIMTDNDIFLFEPISEIKQLSAARMPFLIQEVGDAYRIPDISDFIQHYLGRNEAFIIPNKGKGYSVGFCGLDLSMFDGFDDKAFGELLKRLSNLDVWWKEQAFFVSMVFAFSKNVETFRNQKYFFLCYREPCYRMKSKIFHCICTSDKSSVDRYYSQSSRARFVMPVVDRLRCGASSMLLLVRRFIAPLYRFLFKREEPNANRYRHLLQYLNQTHCQRILEIGVWRGGTARLMIRRSKNRQVEYHGMDVFEESTADLVDKETSLIAEPMRQVLHKLSKVSQNVFLHKGYSKDVFLELYELGLKFDCIWIDGGHSYETVKSDFENYSQLLQKGGVIFIDDYTKDSYLPDVKRYIDNELLSSSRYEVKVHDQWVDYYRGYAYRVVSVMLCG